MERQQGVDGGERKRINWGDLLDEAWGKDEPTSATSVPDNGLPTCDSSVDDQNKENRTENYKFGTYKHTGETVCVSNVGGEGKVVTDAGILHLKRKIFSEISNPSKPEHTERNRKRLVERDNRRSARNAPRPINKTKLQLKRSVGGNKKREKLHQLCLDLGQKSFRHATCGVCGMVYSLGHATDEADHARFHRRYLSGVSFHGWKHERVVEVFFDGRVLVVFPDDRRHHLRKVRELCSLVDSELGLAAGVCPWRPTTKVSLPVCIS